MGPSCHHHHHHHHHPLGLSCEASVNAPRQISKELEQPPWTPREHPPEDHLEHPPLRDSANNVIIHSASLAGE
eukprot:1703062-Pyramimonas_sp.AAC.1